MKNYKGLDVAASILLIIGGLNWGMIGLFDIDVISNIFNSVSNYEQAPNSMSALTRIIFIVVGLAAIYRIVFLAKNNSRKK